MEKKGVTTIQAVIISVVVTAIVVGGAMYAFMGVRAPPKKKKGFVPVLIKGLGSYFWTVTGESPAYEAKKLGYTSVTQGAKLSATKLNNMIREYAELSATEMIIVNCLDGVSQSPAIGYAMDKGIPVGAIDVSLTKGEAAITVAFDPLEGGRDGARKLIKLLKEKYGELSPDIKVVALEPLVEAKEWHDRIVGFLEIMEDTPCTVDTVYGGGSPREFGEAMSEYIGENPDVDAIWQPSTGDFIVGALKALDREGLLYYRGEPEHVIVCGVDGYPSDASWIKKGYMDFTVNQDPVAYGMIAVDLIQEYIIEKGLDKIPTPLTYEKTDRYYFGKVLDLPAKITDSPVGPRLWVPHYIMDATNYDSKYHWYVIAEEELGIEPMVAKLVLSPKGTPPPTYYE